MGERRRPEAEPPRHKPPAPTRNTGGRNGSAARNRQNSGGTKFAADLARRMKPELFRPPPPIIPQHFAKRPQRRARPAIDNQFRVVEQFAAALLQFIHQRVFLVRIQRLVEAAQFQQRVAPGQQIAQDQFLLARRARLADAPVARANWRRTPATRPSSAANACSMLGASGGQRLGPPTIFTSSRAELRNRAPEISRKRRGIVVQKINDRSRRCADGGVALHRGLFATRQDDFQFFRRIIKLPRGARRREHRGCPVAPR